MTSTCRTRGWTGRVRHVLLLALLLALSSAGSGLAQEQAPAQQPLRILQLRLQVLPEYDDPRVLVIGQGRLSGAELPQAVSFWIPEGAQVNLISGMISAEAELVSQPFTLQPDPQRPGWSLLTSEFDSNHFFYEYYYNGLESDAADSSRKAVAFTFASPLPVERLSLELLQPRGASDFSSDPPASTTRQDARSGFTYHQVESGPLAAGQALGVQIQYTKADPALSVERPQPALDTEDGSTAGLGVASEWTAGGELPPWLALLLGIATAVVVAGLACLAGRRFRPASGPRPGAQPAAAEADCPTCGQPQIEGAFYCNRCGNRLLREMKLEPDPRPQGMGWTPAGKEGR
jgi:hypothetical protein